MPEILLVYVARHGQTELNAAGAFRGNRDVPLDRIGHKQADDLADYFADIPISGIVSSSKLRARETAAAIAGKTGLTPHPTDALHAWDVGMFSGKPKNRQNCDKLECYIQNPDEVIPGGESLNEFKQRVRPCIIEAIDLANHAGKPLLLVGHSSIIHETGSLINGDHNTSLVEPGGVVGIFESNGGLVARPVLKGIKVWRQSSRADTIS